MPSLSVCKSCNLCVRRNDHGIPCDSCAGLTHRTCDTGISDDVYRQAVNSGSQFNYVCQPCKIANPNLKVDTVIVMPYNRTEEMNDNPVSENFASVQNATFVVHHSNGSSSNAPEFSDGDFSDDSLDFDITRTSPQLQTTQIQRRSMVETPITDMILAEPTEVTYEIVESGSTRGALKLVSSDGYSYTVKSLGKLKPQAAIPRNRSRQWRCRKQAPDPCSATVNERHSVFRAGKHNHNHPPDVNIDRKVKVTAMIKETARTDVYRTAADIVAEAMNQQFKGDKFNTANPSYLQRIANRVRSSIRSKYT